MWVHSVHSGVHMGSQVYLGSDYVVQRPTITRAGLSQCHASNHYRQLVRHIVVYPKRYVQVHSVHSGENMVLVVSAYQGILSA